MPSTRGGTGGGKEAPVVSLARFELYHNYDGVRKWEKNKKWELVGVGGLRGEAEWILFFWEILWGTGGEIGEVGVGCGHDGNEPSKPKLGRGGGVRRNGTGVR